LMGASIGSKSKGSKGAPVSDCEEITLTVRDKDLDVGGNNETIFTFSGDATEKGKGGDTFGYEAALVGRGGDCVQTVVLTQNKNSLISIQGACGQKIHAVTGGTGKFAGASGQVKVTEKPKKQTLEVELC